ncbi:MAG: PAS domain S-box protein [Victivallales bacterium]|jgi:PAS domain S-box-containing protein
MAEEKNIDTASPGLREEAVQTMQGGERRFSALVENLSEAIALLGPDGSFLYASPSVSRINGYPMQEFMGKSAFEIIHPDDRALVAQHFQQIQQSPGASTALLIRLQHRDGSWRWIDAMATNRLEDPAIGAIIINYKDITDRKQSDDALRDSEGRYRGLFENMIEGYAYCKMIFENGEAQDFIYLAVNPAFETLTGLRNVIGKKVSELIPGICESDPEIFEIYSRVSITSKPEHFEIYLSSLQMWYSVSVYSPEHGYFVAVFEMISERKRAEKALCESEERHKAILKTAMDGFCRVDLQGRLLEVNEAYCRILGYREDELLAMSIPDLKVAKTSVEFDTRMQRIIAQGEDRFESQHRRRDGSIVEVEISVQYKPEDGCMVAFLRDITERKQSETLLRVQHELFLKLSSVRDLPETLRLCLDAALRVSGLDCGGIYLIDETGGMRLLQSTGLSDDFAKAVSYYPNDAANIQSVIEGVPRYMSHTELEMQLRERKLSEALRSVAIIPIWKEQRIIGSINVASHSLDEIPVRYRAALENIASSVGLLIGRAKVDDELVCAKAEWERTFDAVPDLIALIDRDYRIIRVNRAMAARTGCDAPQLAGARCYEAVHGLAAPPDYCPHAKLLASGKEERAEVAEKRLNGIFDVIVTPLCDEAGLLTGSVHVAHDITERKLAEKALSESEHEKRLILDNASELIAYHDTEQNLVWANQAYQTATKPLAELKGRKCYSCWGLERLCVNCPVSESIRTGEPRGAELTPQNQPHWSADQCSWLVRAAPVKNSAGIVIGAIEIAHDITEKKRAEETLKNREALLSSMGKMARVGGWELDVETGKQVWTDEVYAIHELDMNYQPTRHLPGPL